LSTLGGAFVDFLQILLSTFCRHYRPRGRPRRRVTFARLSFFVGTTSGDTHVACRRRDLWPHSGILLTCSGAACFQNMEVRVLSRASQGKWQPRPAGACQSGRRPKDVTTWRWMGSVKLVVSLLPSAFRLLSMGMRTKKQPMRHHTPCFRRSLDGTGMANPKYGLIRAR
jgi:hypothetical protein